MKCKQYRLKVKIILLVALWCCNAFFAQDKALAGFKSKSNTGSSLSLRIKLNSTDMTGKTHNVWAGRQLVLTVSSKAGPIDTALWTVDSSGLPANGWYGSEDAAHFVQDYTKDQSTLKIAFFKTGGPFSVKVQAVVQGKTESAYAKFNVQKPEVYIEFNSGIPFARRLGSNNIYDFPAGKAVGDGDIDSGAYAGIEATAVFPNGKYGGNIQWVQLLKDVKTSRRNFGSGLDTSYPYDVDTPFFIDAPISGGIKESWTYFNFNFQADAYLMWHAYPPNGGGTVFWVPLKKISWAFYAKGIDAPGNNWVKDPSSHQYGVSVQKAIYPPEWSNVVKP